MEKKISEEYGATVHTIRKNCRFDYENDWDGMDNSLSKKIGWTKTKKRVGLKL